MSSRATSGTTEGVGPAGAAASPAADGLDVLAGFGAAMLRAGQTAARTREWMEVLGRKLTVDNLSVGITLDSIVTSGRREARTATVVREIGPPGVNAERLGALESLAAQSEPGVSPQEIAGQLAAIEKRTAALQRRLDCRRRRSGLRRLRVPERLRTSRDRCGEHRRRARSGPADRAGAATPQPARSSRHCAPSSPPAPISWWRRQPQGSASAPPIIPAG